MSRSHCNNCELTSPSGSGRTVRSSHYKNSKSPIRSAMTLLELVVALTILAVLSTIAVEALNPLADQARYESTQRILRRMRAATVGDLLARNVNGQRIVSGYLADTGAVPTALSDFFVKPAGLAANSSQSFDSDQDSVNDVTLLSGWKGPYLQLGPGESTLLDGWGANVLIDPDAGTFDYTSYGSDGDTAAPEDGYAADLTVAIPTTDYQSTVTFRLFEIDGTTQARIDPTPTGLEQLAVLLYSVNGNGGTDGSIEEKLYVVASTGTFEASKSSFIHGVAAARGILWTDTNSDDVFDSGESIVLSSYVHYFSVTESDLRVEMELR